MQQIARSKSIVYLNLASNELGNEGMTAVFEGLRNNQSVVFLDVSTIEGVARNRVSAGAIEALKTLLEENQFLTDVNLTSIGLGNAGLEAICEVLAKGSEYPR
jgi:Ran GTPase-activating protein (RanGAP) involved in mRNA processing and transport